MDDISSLMLVGFMSMAISMVIIPIAMRLAPKVGMLDKPDQRKVHKDLIPRVGGIGIVTGLVVPLVIFLPLDDLLRSILAGVCVLLVVGAWDDAVELGPYIKFASQVLAAASVVFYGGLHVHNFPFLLEVEVPLIISQLFTTVAIVGVINALNLSDGLDGLAGGEALLSLGAIAYLAITFEGDFATYIAIATVGGIFGFLRFNSHPARVFMGDSGSQALGFLLAVLVVYLSQLVNPVMSPVVPLFLLGLPVIDAIVVFYMRWRRGDRLMVAARDHLHHRLLKLGFYHYESVVIIYTIHSALVLTALLLTYESDMVLMLGFLLFCALLFGAVSYGERTGWGFHEGEAQRQLSLVQRIRSNKVLSNLPFALIRNGLLLFMVVAALTVTAVPTDIGVASALMLVILLLPLVLGARQVLVYRLVLFMTLGFTVYLQTYYTPEWLFMELRFVYIFYVLMVLAIFAAMRLSGSDTFSVSPLDFLVLVLVLAISFLPGTGDSGSLVIAVVVQLIVLFYAAELHIQNMNNMLNSVLGALFAVLIILVIKAFL